MTNLYLRCRRCGGNFNAATAPTETQFRSARVGILTYGPSLNPRSCLQLKWVSRCLASTTASIEQCYARPTQRSHAMRRVIDGCMHGGYCEVTELRYKCSLSPAVKRREPQCKCRSRLNLLAFEKRRIDGKR